MSTYKVVEPTNVDEEVKYLKTDIDPETQSGVTAVVSRADVPADVLAELDAGKELAAASPSKTTIQPEKVCTFCGVGSKLSRILDTQTIYLCDEHYYSKNLGQIAQHVREKEDAEG